MTTTLSGSTGETPFWTAERTDTLRRLWLAGRTYREVANALGTTRNAAIGKADRMKLPRRLSPSAENVKRNSAAPPDLRPGQPTSRAAWQALPGTTPQPVELHREGQCRWPIGDDLPFLYCCASTNEGRIYCPAHDRIGSQPAPPIKFNGKRIA